MVEVVLCFAYVVFVIPPFLLEIVVMSRRGWFAESMTNWRFDDDMLGLDIYFREICLV